MMVSAVGRAEVVMGFWGLVPKSYAPVRARWWCMALTMFPCVPPAQEKVLNSTCLMVGSGARSLVSGASRLHSPSRGSSGLWSM